jgi:hypothetical protein
MALRDALMGGAAARGAAGATTSRNVAMASGQIWHDAKAGGSLPISFGGTPRRPSGCQTAYSSPISDIGKDFEHMIEVLALFRVLVELFVDLGRISGRKLVQPMLTAACLTGAYTAIHITREGSLTAGVRVAFLDGESAKTERHRSEEQTMLQTELRQFAAANKLIDQLLGSMLARATGASRVRLNVIHNGVTGLTGTGLLRYDVTNSVAVAGRLSGSAVSNQPLSDWSDFLPALLAGQCSLHRIGDLHTVAIRARFETFGAASVLVCPAADVQGKTVGAIFIFWDGNDPVPDGDDLRRLMAAGQHLGAQIAAVLDLQGPPPWPSLVPAGG